MKNRIILISIISIALLAVSCSEQAPSVDNANTNLPTSNLQEADNSNNSQQTDNNFYDKINQNTSTWKTYSNNSLALSFQYPNELGEVKEGAGSNGYSHDFSFTKENQSYSYTAILPFSRDSINSYNNQIKIENMGERGPGETNDFPVEIATTIITTKPVDYNCSKDFGLDVTANEFCSIVNINDTKIIRSITNGDGPNGRDASSLAYLFYKDGAWVSFAKTFYVYRFSNDESSYPNSMLSKELNAKTRNEKVKAELDIFDKMLKTVSLE